MTRWNRALVTGASSGIGKAFAELTGPFHELDIDRESAVVDVNITALHRLSHAATASMVERGGGGGISNVSSLAAGAPMPNSATYAATKAFVSWQSADEVAAAGLKGIDLNRAHVMPGGLNRVGAGVLSAMPGAVRSAMVPRFL